MPSGAKHRGAFAAILVAATLALAACGSSDDSADSGESPDPARGVSEKAIQTVGQELRKAYAAGNAAAICDLLDPADLEVRFGNKQKCEKFVKDGIRRQNAVPVVDFDEITVEGEKATAFAGGENNQVSYDFVKVDGKWYIDIGSGENKDSSQTGSEQ